MIESRKLGPDNSPIWPIEGGSEKTGGVRIELRTSTAGVIIHKPKEGPLRVQLITREGITDLPFDTTLRG